MTRATRIHPEPLIPKHGGYRKLKSFQVAQLVYDVTVRFCDRYVGPLQPHARPDGSGRAVRGPEHRRGKPGIGHLEEDRVEASRSWHAPVWKSCAWTTRTSCASASCRSGTRADPRRTALIARRCASADEVAAWAGPARRTRCTQWTGRGVHLVHLIHIVHSRRAVQLPRNLRQCGAGFDRGGVRPARPADRVAGANVRGKRRLKARLYRDPYPRTPELP